MTKSVEIVHFEDNSDIRRAWHNDEWYYSVIDVITTLTNTDNPRRYWSDLKRKLKAEGYDEVYGQIVHLKMEAPDGKMRETDTANGKTVLRIIQSVPSPKAEPFKIWLAQIGGERLEEIEDPELGINRTRERAKQIFRTQGRSEDWIKTRLDGIDVRNQLTDEWKDRGVEEGLEFAILTNTLHEGIFDVSTQGHKKIKNIPVKENLRGHMTRMELLMTEISEAAAIQMHQNRDSQGFGDLKKDATDAGKAGKTARKAFEEAMQTPIISPQNNQQKKLK
jgi:DNA-damage-inducible protein D